MWQSLNDVCHGAGVEASNTCALALLPHRRWRDVREGLWTRDRAQSNLHSQPITGKDVEEDLEERAVPSSNKSL